MYPYSSENLIVPTNSSRSGYHTKTGTILLANRNVSNELEESASGDDGGVLAQLWSPSRPVPLTHTTAAAIKSPVRYFI
jgi:hypothetical protein